jgi:prefoldin subunit 5
MAMNKEELINATYIALGRVNSAIRDLEDELDKFKKKRQELWKELLELEGKNGSS